MTSPLKTIAIAADDSSLSEKLEQGLAKLGFQIVGMAKNGEEAIELVKSKKPQLIVMNAHLPLLTGMEASKRIIAMHQTAIVLILPDHNLSLVNEALTLGVCGYAHETLDAVQLRPILETAWHQFHVISDLQKQIGHLNETLETRKLLEKAKGILMEQQGLSEEAAHLVIQKMSQEQGIAIKEVCRSLIQVKMVLGKMASKRVV